MFGVTVPPSRTHSIAIGGIGGDADSVGITVLKYALRSLGYFVRDLGAQCPLEELSDKKPSPMQSSCRAWMATQGTTFKALESYAVVAHGVL